MRAPYRLAPIFNETLENNFLCKREFTIYSIGSREYRSLYSLQLSASLRDGDNRMRETATKRRSTY
jgi:hypothetical protein